MEKYTIDLAFVNCLEAIMSRVARLIDWSPLKLIDCSTDEARGDLNLIIDLNFTYVCVRDIFL